jgi:putative transposase
LRGCTTRSGARDKDNHRLLTLIRDSYSLSGDVYVSRRVHGDLNEIGETCGKNRVGRIIQLSRIKAVCGYKAPRRIAGRPSVIAPNRVQRQFTVVRANQVWVTDITYIRPWQGWLYLAVVIDLFARNVVGWSMKPTLSRELALDVLMMAVRRRKPDGEVIVHSDLGSQYGSDDWQRFCRANNLAPGMSRRGNCLDNAVAESFFSSLKKNASGREYTKPGIWPGGYLRLHRSVLQPGPAPQSPRRRQSGGLRTGLSVRTGNVYCCGVSPFCCSMTTGDNPQLFLCGRMQL